MGDRAYPNKTEQNRMDGSDISIEQFGVG